MTAAAIPSVASSAAPFPLIGSHATRGALWTIIFSFLNKAVTLGGQLALAWFLVPSDFGLVALALSITSFASMVSGTSLKNLLIQRSAREITADTTASASPAATISRAEAHEIAADTTASGSPATTISRAEEKFAEEAGQVFWLSLTLNTAAALLLMGVSPLAGVIFREPRVVPLILVAALATPLQALPTIYAAALIRQLRFRQIAMIHFGTGLVQYGLAVLLAWQGFGAYALVLPLIAMAVFLAVVSRMTAGRIALGRPQPRRWGALAAPVSWLMLNALFVSIQTYGANFVIGLAHNDPATTGFYYWGCSIASQAIFLLATNLQGVLFPVLSKLNADPARQWQAMQRAAQTLMVVVVPVCVLQMLLAEPVVTLLFHERWLPAIPVVQWLSVGLLAQPLNLLATSVLMARGRFRRLACTTAFMAGVLVAAAGLGAQHGDHAVIARFTGLALLLGNGFAGWIAYRECRSGTKSLLGTVFPPLALGLLAGALSGWARAQTSSFGPLAQILLGTVVFLAAYGFFVRAFLPGVLGGVTARLFHPSNASWPGGAARASHTGTGEACNSLLPQP